MNIKEQLEGYPNFLKISDIMKILNISRNLAIELASKNPMLKAFKVNKVFRVPKCGVVEFIQSQQNNN